MVTAAMAALGILSIASVIRGGVALGIFTLLIAAGVFGLAAYFFWGYRWSAMHPGKLRRAEKETLFRSRMQRKPDEST
jgi:hypothetical protein